MIPVEFWNMGGPTAFAILALAAAPTVVFISYAIGRNINRSARLSHQRELKELEFKYGKALIETQVKSSARTDENYG